MSPAADRQLPAWTQALHQAEALRDRLRFALRLAGYTNQHAIAKSLAAAIDRDRQAAAEVVVIGKPECGATQLAAAIQASFQNLQITTLESPAYADLAAESLARAQSAAAILFAIPAAAPFFDETLEFAAAQFASCKDHVLLVATGDPEFFKEPRPDLSGFALYSTEEFADALFHRLAAAHVAPRVAGMKSELRRASEQLRPILNTFAEFLSMSQAQYARQLEFIRRDAGALRMLARKAQETLDAQSQKALANINEATQGLAQAMRKQAEGTVERAAVTRETLAAQELRTQMGRHVVAAARAAGCSEFDARIQSLAMNLNSSRSLLLSVAGQVRAEALARFSELSLNLGPGLLSAWLTAARFNWPDKPLDVSFDAGSEFPGRIMAAARELRQAIPETAFASGIASRIDSLYRREMNTAATAGWTPTLDQQLATSIYAVWNDAAGRNCGILIGRLHWIYRAVTDGIAAGRLGNLQSPADDRARARLGETWRDFAVRLENIAAEAAIPASRDQQPVNTEELR